MNSENYYRNKRYEAMDRIKDFGSFLLFTFVILLVVGNCAALIVVVMSGATIRRGSDRSVPGKWGYVLPVYIAGCRFSQWMNED
jgi:hypothetical protein